MTHRSCVVCLAAFVPHHHRQRACGLACGRALARIRRRTLADRVEARIEAERMWGREPTITAIARALDRDFTLVMRAVQLLGIELRDGRFKRGAA